MPKVSVVMPAYNAEKYIGEAIDSILSQTFTDFEFIIIDDGSTDRTKEIVLEYDDPRIVLLENEKNSGNEDEIDFLREFEDTDSYKILLNHLPYSWTHYGISEDYDIDLVLSGHTHGGQINLPFVGGLYDPEFGFFPGKISGRFDCNGTTVIVSNGIGSADEMLPRLINPEIVVITSDGLENG